MQELQIGLRSGQMVTLRSLSSEGKIASEFGRFLDEFRLCGETSKEKIFVFGDPVVMVRLSEVASAAFRFLKEEQMGEVPAESETKKRQTRKVAGTKQ